MVELGTGVAGDGAGQEQKQKQRQGGQGWEALPETLLTPPPHASSVQQQQQQQQQSGPEVVDLGCAGVDGVQHQHAFS